MPFQSLQTRITYARFYHPLLLFFSANEVLDFHLVLIKRRHNAGSWKRKYLGKQGKGSFSFTRFPHFLNCLRILKWVLITMTALAYRWHFDKCSSRLPAIMTYKCQKHSAKPTSGSILSASPSKKKEEEKYARSFHAHNPSSHFLWLCVKAAKRSQKNYASLSFGQDWWLSIQTVKHQGCTRANFFVRI